MIAQPSIMAVPWSAARNRLSLKELHRRRCVRAILPHGNGRVQRDAQGAWFRHPGCNGVRPLVEPPRPCSLTAARGLTPLAPVGKFGLPRGDRATMNILNEF